MPENRSWKMSLIFQKEKKLKLGGNETKPQKKSIPDWLLRRLLYHLKRMLIFAKYNSVWHPHGQGSRTKPQPKTTDEWFIVFLAISIGLLLNYVIFIFYLLKAYL